MSRLPHFLHESERADECSDVLNVMPESGKFSMPRRFGTRSTRCRATRVLPRRSCSRAQVATIGGRAAAGLLHRRAHPRTDTRRQTWLTMGKELRFRSRPRIFENRPGSSAIRALRSARWLTGSGQSEHSPFREGYRRELSDAGRSCGRPRNISSFTFLNDTKAQPIQIRVSWTHGKGITALYAMRRAVAMIGREGSVCRIRLGFWCRVARAFKD